MTRALLLGAACALLASAPAARSQPALTPAEAHVGACIFAAAELHRMPPAMLVILLRVEGGRRGATSRNTNGTEDIGPMQVNTIWVRKIAEHWRATPDAAFLALRDNFCANVEGGAWILRQALDETRGDFWTGVGIYHSHNPVHKERYLRLVLNATLRLREQVARLSAGRRTSLRAPLRLEAAR